jgi:hypothetical protein
LFNQSYCKIDQDQPYRSTKEFAFKIEKNWSIKWISCKEFENFLNHLSTQSLAAFQVSTIWHLHSKVPTGLMDPDKSNSPIKIS